MNNSVNTKYFQTLAPSVVMPSLKNVNNESLNSRLQSKNAIVQFSLL